MKTFTITFTIDELKVLDEVLSASGPYKIIAPLVNSINLQVQKQKNKEEVRIPEPVHPTRMMEPPTERIVEETKV